MAGLIPNAVWSLIIDSSTSGVKKFLAFERYFYAVEVAIKKTETTLEYRVDTEKDGIGYIHDRRTNSRSKSKKKNADAASELTKLKDELEEWRKMVREKAREEGKKTREEGKKTREEGKKTREEGKNSTWAKFKYTLTPGSQQKLENLGEKARALDEELNLRTARRDQNNERRRKEEEWNWKQEEQRRKTEHLKRGEDLPPVHDAIPPVSDAETEFSGSKLKLLLVPLNSSFEGTRTLLVPSYPRKCRIGRGPNPDEMTSSLDPDGMFENGTVLMEHAEIWCGGRATVWIKDLGSPSGTFVNKIRLSLPKEESVLPYELRVNDIIELGEDIYDKENPETVQHPMVAARIQQIGLVEDVAVESAENQDPKHQGKHKVPKKNAGKKKLIAGA
jgi:hypothetical protein